MNNEKIIVNKDSEQYLNLTDRLFEKWSNIDIDDIDNIYYGLDWDTFLIIWCKIHNVVFK